MSNDAQREVLMKTVLAATLGGNGWVARGDQVVVAGTGQVICTGAASEDARAIAAAVGGVRDVEVDLLLSLEREKQLRLDLEDLQERLRDAGLDAELVRPDRGRCRLR